MSSFNHFTTVGGNPTHDEEPGSATDLDAQSFFDPPEYFGDSHSEGILGRLNGEIDDDASTISLSNAISFNPVVQAFDAVDGSVTSIPIALHDGRHNSHRYFNDPHRTSSNGSFVLMDEEESMGSFNLFNAEEPGEETFDDDNEKDEPSSLDNDNGNGTAKEEGSMTLDDVNTNKDDSNTNSGGSMDASELMNHSSAEQEDLRRRAGAMRPRNGAQAARMAK